MRSAQLRGAGISLCGCVDGKSFEEGGELLEGFLAALFVVNPVIDASGGLVAEDQSTQLIAEAPGFVRVLGLAETFG
jgi:hypothetical protein